MRYKKQKGNVLTTHSKYYIAHCISADYNMGAGIAKHIQRKHNIRGVLKREGDNTFPDCIITKKIINLVTKKKYYHKPKYRHVEQSLIMMRDKLKEHNIKYVVMPKIGSGLDRLSWARVENIIKKVFKNEDVEILVKYL